MRCSKNNQREVHSNTGLPQKTAPLQKKKKNLKLTYHLQELEKEEQTSKQIKTESQQKEDNNKDQGGNK